MTLLPQSQQGADLASRRRAWEQEEMQWGMRRNKGEAKQYEVFRHKRKDAVTPYVVAAFASEQEAEYYLRDARFAACWIAATGASHV